MTDQRPILVMDASEVLSQLADMRREQARIIQMLVDMMSGQNKDELTVGEYAKYINRSKSTVWRLVEAGRVVSRREGNVLLIKLDRDQEKKGE